HVDDRGQRGAWLADCNWIELNQESMQWAAENAADVEAKRAKYLPEWNAKAERPVLAPEDGQ
ncbi:MAG TPA: hypothetical protein VH560_02610, partial [Polyangia bacterium]|nr:hypothetical protein [Polyangia bacterium]